MRLVYAFCPLLCWFVTYQFYVEFSIPKSQRNRKFWSSCGSRAHSLGSSSDPRKNLIFLHIEPSTSLCSGPLTDTCGSFRPSPSETRGVNLCGTTEGVRMGLCRWNFVHSALPRSPVIPHSVLIKCYGIFPCCTPQCTYNVLWYSPFC